jgi:hypothetical protein
MSGSPSVVTTQETDHAPFYEAWIRDHLPESGTNLRTVQLWLGYRSLATTARYLRVATTSVCAKQSPFDLLPAPPAPE